MQEQVERLVAASSDRITWSVSMRRDGEVCADHASGAIRPSASMGKLFLLVELARLLESGALAPEERLSPEPEDLVADSGLWQHMDEPALSVSSLAVLVGATSDNLASNVLLRRVSLESVQDVSELLGMPSTRMLDRLRDVRTAADPPAPSQSRAADLSLFMSMLSEDRVVSANVSARVRGWLRLGVDLSMVASAFDLDPLAHADAGAGVTVVNKTGTDAGVRSDAGIVGGTRRGTPLAYAVMATWDPADEGAVAPAMATMREFGVLIREMG